VRSIVADCVGLFFWRSEILLGNSQKMFETVVGACTVISRSFPRLVNIVAWPGQQQFAYRGKFQKLCNDREEIIHVSKLKLVFPTSYPRNQK